MLSNKKNTNNSNMEQQNEQAAPQIKKSVSEEETDDLPF